MKSLICQNGLRAFPASQMSSIWPIVAKATARHFVAKSSSTVAAPSTPSSR